MSTTYIARVFVSGRLDANASPHNVREALAEVASTASFHGSAWIYTDDPERKDVAIGALVSFDIGLASPFAGRCPALLRALRASLRAVVGRWAYLDVALLDADRAAWFDGKRDA